MLGKLFDWVTTTGQQQAAALGYSPLPANVVPPGAPDAARARELGGQAPVLLSGLSTPLRAGSCLPSPAPGPRRRARGLVAPRARSAGCERPCGGRRPRPGAAPTRALRWAGAGLFGAIVVGLVVSLAQRSSGGRSSTAAELLLVGHLEPGGRPYGAGIFIRRHAHHHRGRHRPGRADRRGHGRLPLRVRPEMAGRTPLDPRSTSSPRCRASWWGCGGCSCCPRSSPTTSSPSSSRSRSSSGSSTARRTARACSSPRQCWP